MMKSVIINLAVLTLSIKSFGQKTTYVGIESGPKFEVYESTDHGNALQTDPFFHSPIYGLTIGQEINNVFTLETGFFINDYGQSYRIDGQGAVALISNAITSYQIPVRIKARLNVLKDKLSLETTVGYTLAINSNYGSSGYGSANYGSLASPNSDNIRTEYLANYSLVKSFGLIEAGVAVNFTFNNSMICYLAANYLTGMRRVVEMDVKYWTNFGPERTGTIFSNGDYYSITLGMKYPISNLWAKASAAD